MKYNTFKLYRQAWQRASHRTPFVPLNIDIELASVCNLKCPFCLISDPEYRKLVRNNPKFIDYYTAVDIINEAHQIGVPALKFNWIGEPTLNPDFNRIMQYAGSLLFHELIVNTNGNYHVSKNDGLMYATKVLFSVDSFWPKRGYAKMRKGGNLKRVISNVKDLINKGHTNIWIRRVITDINEKEEFEYNAYKTFKNNVNVSSHYVFNRKVGNKIDNQPERKYCGYPSQRLVIDTNLDIYPCCVDYSRNMKIGEYRRGVLLNIWYSDKLNKIRRYLKRNKMPSDSCKNCTSWLAYDDWRRKYVK